MTELLPVRTTTLSASTPYHRVWELSPLVEVFELVPPESALDPDQPQNPLSSSDLELGETIKPILGSIERVRPKRVVIDSLSEIAALPPPDSGT